MKLLHKERGYISKILSKKAHEKLYILYDYTY